jgi:hypothetical protein
MEKETLLERIVFQVKQIYFLEPNPTKKYYEKLVIYSDVDTSIKISSL